MPESQRRHHRRVEAAWPVTCWRIADNGLPGEPFVAETVDLSAGGMAMVTDEPIFRPTRVLIQLKAAGLDMVMRGVVVRVGSHNGRLLAALRFEGLDREAKAAIVRMVFREAQTRGQGSRTVRPGDVRWWHDRPRDDSSPEAAEAV
jgi:c-di-GMP-binding flagellar brake protein YcgR